MIDVLTTIACLTLAGLTVFQLALVCGAPIGTYAWSGKHTVLPVNLRIGSVVSILLYGIFAIIILSKAKAIVWLDNQSAIDVSIWVLAVYFYIGVLMNAISRSKAERNLMTPIALLLAVTVTTIALL